MRNNSKCSKYFLIAFFLLTSTISGSTIVSKINKDSLTVGERLNLQVFAIIPKGAIITPPSTDNGFGNILVKEWNSQKSERENIDSVNFSYVITTYVPENCTIPSLSYIVQDHQQIDTLKTQPIQIKIQSVIPFDTVDIKDLKPQQVTGHAPLWWMWLLISILIIIACIIVYRVFFKKIKNKETVVPLLPPYEEAIAALSELEGKKYLQRGLIREYVFELSEIVKRYIGRRFTINASEFTTEEMIAWIEISDLDDKQRQPIQWFFTTSDPVKFAKLIPDNQTIDKFSSVIHDFIEQTRPVFQDSNKVGNSSTSDQRKSVLNNVNQTTTTAAGDKR